MEDLGRVATKFWHRVLHLPRTEQHGTVPKAPTIPFRVTTMYCSSFVFKGLRLFNTLPKYLKDLHEVGVDVFTEPLDHLLPKFPRAVNSLFHQKLTV